MAKTRGGGRSALSANDLDRQLDRAIGLAYASRLPASFCHYTDADGAVGILRQKLIRVFDVKDQDDKRELHHADAIVVAATERFAREGLGVERAWFADLSRRWPETGLAGVPRDVFIACFTSSPDNDALWQSGIGRHETGCALEFKVLEDEKLELPYLGMTWGLVEYNAERAKARLERAFGGVVTRWRSSLNRGDDARHVAKRALWLACCYASIFTKGPRYDYEQEWRLAVVPRWQAEIVPAKRRYIEVKLRQDGGRPELQALHLGRESPASVAERVGVALADSGYPPVAVRRRG